MSSIWKRLLGKTNKTQSLAATEPLPPTPSPEAEKPRKRVLAEFLRVIEVSDGEFFAGSLFRRRFNCESFPDTPKHFVALYQHSDGSLLTLGYVHFEMWGQHAMCGGLVINERAWRLLPNEERSLIREQGGVAEVMLRRAFKMLPSELVAIWGYVGDHLARKVDMRVGFLPTWHEHIMVIWRNELEEPEKAALIQKVIDYGPF